MRKQNEKFVRLNVKTFIDILFHPCNLLNHVGKDYKLPAKHVVVTLNKLLSCNKVITFSS